MYRILDRNGVALAERDDHIDARHELQTINAKAGRPIADVIVDERGTVFSSMRSDTSRSVGPAMVIPLHLSLPGRVVENLRAVAGNGAAAQRDLAREAIGAFGRPALFDLDACAHVVPFRMRIPVALRDMLEDVARARGTSVEQVATAAIVAWSETAVTPGKKVA